MSKTGLLILVAQNTPVGEALVNQADKADHKLYHGENSRKNNAYPANIEDFFFFFQENIAYSSFNIFRRIIIKFNVSAHAVWQADKPPLLSPPFP